MSVWVEEGVLRVGALGLRWSECMGVQWGSVLLLSGL